MTQATITITTDTARMRRILDILDEDEGPVDAAAISEARRRFVGALSDNCREVVSAIAGFSLQHRSISRTQLAHTASFNDAQLNGVVGTVGKRWAQFVGGQNPFIGQRSSADQDWQYRIDADLAQQLVDELVNH